MKRFPNWGGRGSAINLRMVTSVSVYCAVLGPDIPRRYRVGIARRSTTAVLVEHALGLNFQSLNALQELTHF